MVTIKKKSWLNKNSIFTKIFVPVIIIMLIQAGIINMFLSFSGTIGALENNALDVLAKNVQTRGINLEHLMVNYWSNIGHLERAVKESIEAYLTANELAISDLLGDTQREAALLHELAYSLIDTLRITSATGVYMYFLDAYGFNDTVHNLNGLYFRSLSPLAQRGQAASLANLMQLRGPVEIARANNIPLDSLWEEMFTFDPQYEAIWRGFANPQLAFAQFPDAVSHDLSYWNGPHVLHPWSPRDANWQVSYTRPVIVNGVPVAIIGTDMQLSQMERHFPSRDLDNFHESGYMLVRFSASDRHNPYFISDIFQIAGGFLNRLFVGRQTMTLTQTQREDVYTATEHLESYLVIHPLRLYNTHTPFADEQWALVAVSTARSLFEMSRSVNNAVFASTILSVAAGGVVLLFVIKNFTKPIGLIIKKIEQSDGTSLLTDSNTYEIDLLCHTINEMVERRKKAETQTLEERQRYLLALENSADTFMEYDLQNNVLSVYYFTEEQQTPSVTTVPNLSQVVAAGQFMHPDDVSTHEGPFSGGTLSVHECRIQPQFLPHLDSSVLDDGYFWVHIKMRYIIEADGNFSKVIGTVREITKEKLAEQDALETIRRDVTTGFYSGSYGMQMLEGITNSAFTLIGVINFNEMEMAYGRIFGGIYMAEFAHKLSLLLDEGDFAVRLGNDTFLLHLQNNTKKPAIRKAFDSLYCGEKTDIAVGLDIRRVSAANVEQLKPLPVNVHLDLSAKENLNEVVLELFERSLHIGSSVNILIAAIGRLFELGRVIVMACDGNFSTLQVSHQWCAEGVVPVSSEIKKVPAQSFHSIKESLCADGTLVYKNRANAINPLLETILCLTPENTVTFCCEIYENAVSAGRILFVSNDGDEKTWSDSDRFTLQTITKIIATYLSADKLRSASKAKSLFLSRVSHEIRTPMNAIIGLTNIALTLDPNSEHDYERMRGNLRKIYTSANYMLGLINDVLEMSRVESGRHIQIDERPFNLYDLVNSVDDLMRFPIEEQGLRFDVVNRIQNNRVVGDEYRLKQVIINLLGNANKFTKTGGTVMFVVEELEEPDEKLARRYTFTVKDTGVGIPLDRQTTIFNPFEQVESTVSPGSMQGTGLGLAISRSIISAMKSKIELQSELGAGSAFSFTICLQLDDSGGEAKSSQDTALDYDFTGKRLLVVDDIDINIEITSFILEEYGFLVDTATNGQEALDKFFAAEIGHYDAILMDIQMPVMDGITATKEIRKSLRKDSHNIPILAITANAFDEDLKKSIESGMDGHINKPIQEEELLAILKKFV